MDSANKVFGFFATLLLAYVLAYCFLLRTEKMPMIGSLGLMSWERRADYQLGGKTAKQFFTPLNKMDRRMRPEYWNGVDDVSHFTQSLDIPLNPPKDWLIGIGGCDPWFGEPDVTIKGLSPVIFLEPPLLHMGGLSIRELLASDDTFIDGMYLPCKRKPPILLLTPPWERD